MQQAQNKHQNAEQKWTPAQLSAINTKNKTLLLSAAAGSGKTTTLTERIIRSLIEQKADISDMLIVTFTRASANDLRAKIFKELSRALANDPTDRHLTSQLVKLGGARISTIDAFYLSAVRQNFATLGLSSSFRIADSSETALLAKSVMSDVVNKFYDTDADFPALCECFEKIRDAEDIMEGVLLGLYSDCLYTPEGVEYLRICADDMLKDSGRDLFDTVYGRVLKDFSVGMLSDYLEHYEKALGYMTDDEYMMRSYYDRFDADRLFMIRALNALTGKNGDGSYAQICSIFASHAFAKLGTIKAKNATERTLFCKNLRNSFKDSFKSLRTEFYEYSPDSFSKFFEYTAKNLRLLYNVLTEFEERYMEEKRRRNILELADVKRYALRLFCGDDGNPTDIAKIYAEQFSDIYIDEYQDVDPVQDLIFRCIATPRNRFMVGDIKQSIYSFRGAEPKLFAEYRAKFPNHGTQESEDADCETIFMSENFRCAKPVINFTNLVCSDIFAACGDSIGYTHDDDLVFRKKLPEGAPPSEKVTVAYFAKAPVTDTENTCDEDEIAIKASEAEAKYIAYEIKRLLESGKNQDGEPYKPGDIAVLFRNKSSATHIADALTRLNIKSTATDSTAYFENPDVLMVLCILNAVDNPQRDIHLAGALRSPIYGFTLDDILRINSFGCDADSLYDKLCLAAVTDSDIGRKCKKFNDTLCGLRSMSVSLPIDKFLKKLFASDAFVASGLVCEKSTTGEGGNLQRLYEYARTFEAGSFKGLYNFIEFINTIIENGASLEVTGQDISPDCVTLTTIHKSKGLEFPVCFVCNAASRFKTGDKDSSLSFEYDIGVAIDLADETGFARYASPLKKILDLYTKLRYTEEEMRVLYVAMTRAKEKLYITGNYPQRLITNVMPAAEFDAQFNSRYNIISASSYMDWVLPATCAAEDDSDFEVLGFTPESVPDLTADTTEAEEEKASINRELYDRLREKFAYEYPYKELKKVPSKLSVSRLSPDALDEDDGCVELFETDKKTVIPDFFLPVPSRSSAAERGTATHLFLQFCDFGYAKKHGIGATLDMLVAKRFIPEDMAKLLYMEDLEKLLDSELTESILSAKRVIREQRFNMLLPTSEFTQDKDLKANVRDMKTAVQGVIDLILIDGNGRICLYDYKTDRLTRVELADDSLAAERMNRTHGLQLSYYARAVQYLFGKAPDRVAVYSTCSAKLYDITPTELSIPHDIL
ncbi:MAG: UvrD-helicase domain-containing protein [Clostridia bacterium]|nr:UvrD-helicase domain-containing protein [Clostridia bacterium]